MASSLVIICLPLPSAAGLKPHLGKLKSRRERSNQVHYNQFLSLQIQKCR